MQEVNSIMSVHVFGQLISRLKNTGSPSERKGEVTSWWVRVLGVCMSTKVDADGHHMCMSHQAPILPSLSPPYIAFHHASTLPEILSAVATHHVFTCQQLGE